LRIIGRERENGPAGIVQATTGKGKGARPQGRGTAEVKGATQQTRVSGGRGIVPGQEERAQADGRDAGIGIVAVQFEGARPGFGEAKIIAAVADDSADRQRIARHGDRIRGTERDCAGAEIQPVGTDKSETGEPALHIVGCQCDIGARRVVQGAAIQGQNAGTDGRCRGVAGGVDIQGARVHDYSAGKGIRSTGIEKPGANFNQSARAGDVALQRDAEGIRINGRIGAGRQHRGDGVANGQGGRVRLQGAAGQGEVYVAGGADVLKAEARHLQGAGIEQQRAVHITAGGAGSDENGSGGGPNRAAINNQGSRRGIAFTKDGGTRHYRRTTRADNERTRPHPADAQLPV